MSRNVKQILNHLAEKKRDAYVDYFTHYVVGKNENTAMLGISDADDLYDYFLTDVKTSADFETSYVSDALASVQQYINNILNQKEPGYSGEFSEELQQWWSGYLGHISLWKAYQKMEDYPEDYNLPDYVTDKTKLFSDFSADLGSDSLNDAGIQTAFLKYLRSYEAVNAISVISGYIDYPGERNDQGAFPGYGFLNSDYFFVGKNNSSPAGFYWREANIRADKSDTYISPRAWHEWQPLVITEDAKDILQMRIVKVSGCLFIVYLVGKEETIPDEEKPTEGNEVNNKKKYKVKLKLSRMGLDGKWDIPEQLYEKIYGNETKKKNEDKQDAGKLISVAFTQDEQRDDYLVIAWQDTNNETIFSNVLNVIKQQSAVGDAEFLGADWQKKLASRFFTKDKNTCQHRIFGIEKDIKSIESIDSDPNLSLEAFYCRKNTRHQLRIRGCCHRSAKIPNLISLNLQATVREWSNGRVIVSGDRNNVIVRAEATEGADYLALSLLDGKKLVELKKTDFINNNGITSAEKTLSLSQEQCDQIAKQSYKEIRSGAGFSYQIKSGGAENLLAHYKNSVTTVMQPVTVPVELSVSKGNFVEKGESKWTGDIIYQKDSHTPWRTYLKDDDESETTDIDFQFKLKNDDKEGNFKVTISKLSAKIPVIETFSAHQQFLTFNQEDAELKYVRLNSVQVRDLIYRAKIAVRHIFDWDAQITEEPGYEKDEKDEKEKLDLYGANSRYLWELFFYLPYLVASRYSQGRLYYQARQWLRYIFSPYDGHRLPEKNKDELLPPPYWNCRILTQTDLQHKDNDYALPDPYTVSEDAPSHYRKSVYLMYVDTLISEADLNYRQLSRDSITKAWGLYHQAQGMMGYIPKERSLPKWQPCTVSELLNDKTYSVHEDSLPEFYSKIHFENMPKQLKGFFWYGSLGNSQFRLPVQESLQSRQSILDQRLFNLRHYLDIEGNMMNLPLYAAAFDPFGLLRSRLGGTSELAYLQSGSLSIPSYCFRTMLEKAKEQAAALITLGDKRLNYYEQKERYHTENIQLKDAIALAGASADIQSSLLEQQKTTLLSLKAAKTMADNKQKHYENLSSGGTSTKECQARNLLVSSSAFQSVASGALIAAGIASAFPRLFGLSQDTGDHGKGAFLAVVGGATLGAELIRGTAEYVQLDEQYRRRQEEWNFSAEQAKNEAEVLNEQIKAQKVAITAAENSVKYTELLQAQAKSLYNYFSQTRQVNESLYEKMANIIGLLHDQLCSLVRVFCSLTEASWRYETDNYKRQTFIPGDLWSGDNLGILVGVKLQKALLEMEMEYTQQNTRRLNITKTISLKSLVSNQLVKTDETQLTKWEDVKKALIDEKKLSFGLSHQFFDIDFPGHYARKIHSLSVTFPTLLPPYQNMRVLLEQTSNTLLVSPDIDAVRSLYTPTEQINSESIRRNLLINQKVILSRGSDDNGEFPEDTFTGGQYHSFEHTGAVSHWQLSIPRPEKSKEIIDNLNDIVIKLNYTARSGNDAFEAEVNNLLESIESGEIK